MCDRIISEDPFSIRYVSKQYITQQMCDEAVDDCLAKIIFLQLFMLMKIYSI